MSEAVISIVTINYNNFSGLKKTFESVFNQTRFDRVDYVVIDGGSSDGSAELVKKNENKLAYSISEPDGGIYDAMNKGLRRCTGDLVWFMNSGDYLYSEDVVERILELYKKDVDVVYGKTMMVSESGEELGLIEELTTHKLPDQLTWKTMKYGMSVGHQSFLMRRSKAPEYDLTYKYVADVDWVIKCLKVSEKIFHSRMLLSAFLVDGYSSQNRSASNKERFRVLSKHFGVLPNLANHFVILLRYLFKK